MNKQEQQERLHETFKTCMKIIEMSLDVTNASGFSMGAIMSSDKEGGDAKVVSDITYIPLVDQKSANRFIIIEDYGNDIAPKIMTDDNGDMIISNNPLEIFNHNKNSMNGKIIVLK